MTIEEFIVNYLDGALSVPVSGDVPSPVLPSFVTVEKTGGGRENKISSATVAVQSWAESRADAADLCAAVEAAMEAIVEEPEISRCALDSSYNFPDLERKKPRYQAVFSIVHYL